VRSIAKEQREHASETLHTLQEQTVSETSTIFNNAVEGFNETLQGMKQMASEMQQELETTRAELRRGILELPQETAETAAQMRRVIVDQIDALAELNRIVARHGRGVDAVEPARRPVREETPPSPAARMEAPAPRPSARPDLSGGSFVPAPRRSDSPALSPNGSAGSGLSGNRNNGWLSDLPQRAQPRNSPLEIVRPVQMNARPATRLSRSIHSRSISHA
jgi:hypothetical protein